MTALEWRIVPPEEVADLEAHRCRSRRGIRSKIECEQDIRTHWADEYGQVHTGRSDRGYWYTW